MIEPYYQHDGITIYNADCRDVLPELGEFDLLLTDPPYGLGKKLHTEEKGVSSSSIFAGSFPKSELGWDIVPESDCIKQVIAAATEYVMWGGNYFCDSLTPAQCVLVWDKMNGTNSMADCEIALTSLQIGAKVFSRHHFSKGCGGKVHPTQKPLPLMQWCLSWLPDAKTVLDPFMGSGTTLVAAKMEGRQAVGIELSEKYCEAAVNRLAQGVLF